MLAVCNCYTRNCKHYLGISQPDGTEMTEVNYCKAFPDGIPSGIAYGSNRHTTPLQDQGNGIVFEEETVGDI